MDILVSSDRGYLRQTATMVYSLAKRVEEEIKVWFLDGGLSAKDKDAFTSLLGDKLGVTVTFIGLGNDLLASLALPRNISHISVATYFRLAAPYLLPEYVERVLWLDSDIIVKGDPTPFYNQDLDGLYLIACENTGGKGDEARLGLPEGSVYFNAGVMLMNLPMMRSRCGLEELLAFCKDNKDRIPLQDQDLLNLLYSDKRKVLRGGKYNCMSNKSRPEAAVDAAVVHFAGWQKPWKIRWQDGFSHYWWEIREEMGITCAERMTRALGNVWKALGINKLILLVEMPFNWLGARVRK